MPPDQVRLVRDRVSGIEAIRARFAGHAYDLHRHDDWLVGVTEHGVQDFFCRGALQRSTPNRVILIEPQEAHDGQAGNVDGFSYCMLYLPRAWLSAALAAHDQRGCDDRGFSASLVDDARLARAIRRACHVLGRLSASHQAGTGGAVGWPIGLQPLPGALFSRRIACWWMRPWMPWWICYVCI